LSDTEEYGTCCKLNVYPETFDRHGAALTSKGAAPRPKNDASNRSGNRQERPKSDLILRRESHSCLIIHVESTTSVSLAVGFLSMTAGESIFLIAQTAMCCSPTSYLGYHSKMTLSAYAYPPVGLFNSYVDEDMTEELIQSLFGKVK
jgi:hypothetical protein